MPTKQRPRHFRMMQRWRGIQHMLFVILAIFFLSALFQAEKASATLIRGGGNTKKKTEEEQQQQSDEETQGNNENPEEQQQQQQQQGTSRSSPPPPNIVVFIVDDLGYNQVGYHARRAGNHEIQTPHIDKHVAAGIEMKRGYMTPWCGPSRSAMITGRTNIYNANVTNGLFSFDDDIGYVAGLPPDTDTIATIFKRYGESIGKKYTAFYNGKWGIGGASFHNTPVGAGFDYFRGSFGNGIETCDGLIPTISTIAPYKPLPFDKEFGPLMVNTLKAYWEQDLNGPESSRLCPYFHTSELLTAEEKAIACKTIPRTPPKIIDLDVLDKVEEQILTHDYENTGPILQIFSTMMMHLPMAYPAEYNEAEMNQNYTNGMPPYFARDKIKPPPNNDDNRWATNQGVRFVDDLFGRTMEAIKKAGQWNNTIVYFTSDNGGVIYHGTANNNYPLRASKFSPFEGGIRVPQFISGGWINQQLSIDRNAQSNTYIFPNDLVPTLLEMAGASNARSFVHGTKTGAPYGNAMWEYIKNSVDPTKPQSSHQKFRKVSYSKDMFFDVQENRTIKKFYTGDNPFSVPRLYEPVWPKNGDLVMDTVYMSINPCRPGGTPSDCCILDIEQDWQERNPLPSDCEEMHLEANNLFEIEGGCPKNKRGRNLNKVCFETGEISDGTDPENLSLWSHYGAAGPFTNSKGQPLSDLPMKCACYGLIDDRASASDVNYFVVRNMGPSQCGKAGLLSDRPAQSVKCDGTYSFGFSPKENILDDYFDEGFPLHYERSLDLEKEQKLLLDTIGALRAMVSYAGREGYTEWAAMGKFPFNGAMDTCKEKNVAPVPFPVQALTPYMFGTRDPSVPFEDISFIGLCSPATTTQYFCPSHQNANLKAVVEWSFDKDDLYGTFADNSTWKPMGLVECSIKCRKEPKGTAYIGDGPYGLLV